MKLGLASSKGMTKVTALATYTYNIITYTTREEWDMAYIPWEKLTSPEAEGWGGCEFLSWYRHGSKKSDTVSGIQNGCHIPLPLNHGRGIWDHIPLVRKGYMGSYTSSNSGFWFAKNIGHGIKVVSILIYPHPYKVMSPMYKILSVH